MEEKLIAAGAAIFVGLLIRWAVKKYPKERLLDVVLPVVATVYTVCEATVGRFLGERNVDKLEQAFIPSVAYVLRGVAEYMEQRALERKGD